MYTPFVLGGGGLSRPVLTAVSFSPASVRFAPHPVITHTYGSKEYVREAWEEQRFSKRELSRLHRDLDAFKLLEMDIHPQSIQNTFLYKKY